MILPYPFLNTICVVLNFLSQIPQKKILQEGAIALHPPLPSVQGPMLKG